MGAILNTMARIGVTKKVTFWEVGGAAPGAKLRAVVCTRPSALAWYGLGCSLLFGWGMVQEAMSKGKPPPLSFGC